MLDAAEIRCACSCAGIAAKKVWDCYQDWLETREMSGGRKTMKNEQPNCERDENGSVQGQRETFRWEKRGIFLQQENFRMKVLGGKKCIEEIVWWEFFIIMWTF